MHLVHFQMLVCTHAAIITYGLTYNLFQIKSSDPEECVIVNKISEKSICILPQRMNNELLCFLCVLTYAISLGICKCVSINS